MRWYPAAPRPASVESGCTAPGAREPSAYRPCRSARNMEFKLSRDNARLCFYLTRVASTNFTVSFGKLQGAIRNPGKRPRLDWGLERAPHFWPGLPEAGF